tara:strand:+ start:609 stop:959 length:351 start_codon:yes stop_codon:yes gene_type:complete
MFSKFRALFPTIIFILVCVLVSMVVLNFFQVDMNDNNGFRVLNRMLTVEGMKNGNTGILKETLKNGKKEQFSGMCASGKHVEGMCGGMGCEIEGMESKEEEEEKNELGAFASSLMD